MAYQKIVVDNLICKRRFHLSFDDAAPSQAQVELRCLHCSAPVFSRSNHPSVRLVREENLVSTTSISPLQAKHCNFSKHSGKPAQ